MENTLAKLLPVAVASAVSPLLLTASILTLASSKRALAKSLMLVVGAFLTLVPVSVFILFFDKSVAQIQAGSSGTGRDILHVVVGLALIALVTHNLLKKNKKKSRPMVAKNNLWEYVGAGFGLMLVNVTTLMMYVPAAAILNQGGLSVVDKVAGLVEMVLFSLLPLLIGPAMVLILGRHANTVLLPMNRFMNKYGNDLIAVIFGILGLILFLQGLLRLL